MPLPYPKEFAATVVETYRRGGTIKSAADHYGLSANTVSKWIDDAGVRKRWPGEVVPPNEAEDQRIRAMLAEGMPLKEIARGHRIPYHHLLKLYPEDRWTPSQSAKLARAVARSNARNNHDDH